MKSPAQLKIKLFCSFSSRVILTMYVKLHAMRHITCFAVPVALRFICTAQPSHSGCARMVNEPWTRTPAMLCSTQTGPFGARPALEFACDSSGRQALLGMHARKWGARFPWNCLSGMKRQGLERVSDVRVGSLECTS